MSWILLLVLFVLVSLVFFIFIFLPAGSARRAALPVFRLLDHGPILGFFAPQGRHVEPIKVKFGCQI